MENSFSRKRSQGPGTAPTAMAAEVALGKERLQETLHGPRANKTSYPMEQLFDEVVSPVDVVEEEEADILAEEITAAYDQQPAPSAAAMAGQPNLPVEIAGDLGLNPGSGLTFRLGEVEEHQEWGELVPDPAEEFPPSDLRCEPAGEAAPLSADQEGLATEQLPSRKRGAATPFTFGPCHLPRINSRGC